MVDKAKREAEWAEAARLCPLSEDEVRMARVLGLNPRSLVKSIPDPQDATKAPVGAWVRERYEKRQARAAQKPKPRAPRSGAPRAAAEPPPAPRADVEPPPTPEPDEPAELAEPTEPDEPDEPAELPPDDSLDTSFEFESETSHADWLEDVRAELSLGLHDEDSVERIEEEPPQAAEAQDVQPRGRRPPPAAEPQAARPQRERRPPAPERVNRDAAMPRPQRERRPPASEGAGRDEAMHRPQRERRPSAPEGADRDEAMLRRQQSFRLAAEYVAQAFAALPAVSKVALFGSVAVPLEKETSRPTRSRRGGEPVLHDCRDIDLAVWLSGPDALKALQRARSDGLVKLARDHRLGVAHHQVEVFVMAPGTGRYLGRLCNFSQCPKGKPECQVPGCGEIRFLQKLSDFVLEPSALEPGRAVILFERSSAPAAEPEGPDPSGKSDRSDPSDQSDQPSQSGDSAQPDAPDGYDDPVPF